MVFSSVCPIARFIPYGSVKVAVDCEARYSLLENGGGEEYVIVPVTLNALPTSFLEGAVNLTFQGVTNNAQ